MVHANHIHSDKFCKRTGEDGEFFAGQTLGPRLDSQQTVQTLMNSLENLYIIGTGTSRRLLAHLLH